MVETDNLRFERNLAENTRFAAQLVAVVECGAVAPLMCCSGE